MSDIVWEIYQQGKVAAAVADAQHAVSKAYESNANADSLEKSSTVLCCSTKLFGRL